MLSSGACVETETCSHLQHYGGVSLNTELVIELD